MLIEVLKALLLITLTLCAMAILIATTILYVLKTKEWYK